MGVGPTVGRVTPFAVGAGVGVGVAVVAVVAFGVGAGVGRVVGRWVAAGVGVGFGVGLGVGLGVGVGAGVGLGRALIVTLPAESVASLRSLARAVKMTVWVPAGRVPDQPKVTPRPHAPFVWRVMACATPPTTALTTSARAPEAFWYTTVRAIFVAVVPVRGETVPSDNTVLDGAAAIGAA
jgi:hypothetical protein